MTGVARPDGGPGGKVMSGGLCGWRGAGATSAQAAHATVGAKVRMRLQ